VPEDELAKKLREQIKPEAERMRADHRRTMGLIFNAPTDERPMPPKRKFPFMGVAVLVVIVILTVVIFDWLHGNFELRHYQK
jgi:hypothetical protein